MKEHLNDYEKRIWEGIDKDAEEIIKMVEADPEAMSAEPVSYTHLTLPTIA